VTAAAEPGREPMEPARRRTGVRRTPIATRLLAPAAALVVALVVVASPSPAGACDCGGLTDDEYFTTADAVFEADVAAVQGPEGPHASTDPSRWVFDVRRVFKGDVLRTQPVLTESDGASCGLELAGSGPFLIYASLEASQFSLPEGHLYAGLCGGSRAVDPGAPVPAGFGAGAAPADPVDDAPDDAAPRPGDDADGGDGDGPVSAPLVLGVVVALVAAVAGALLASGRRRPHAVPGDDGAGRL
jgi:hypothetical protein